VQSAIGQKRLNSYLPRFGVALKSAANYKRTSFWSDWGLGRRRQQELTQVHSNLNIQPDRALSIWGRLVLTAANIPGRVGLRCGSPPVPLGRERMKIRANDQDY
jgi:hypothetical protein